MTPSAEALTGRAIELVKKLVAFDSVSSRSNIPIIQFIEDTLAIHRIHYELVPSSDGLKTNLLARIGPDVAGGVVLSGHTDVVPVEGQSWDSDPFSVVEKNGKLFGRGTCDMKSFIAVCLAMVPEFVKLPLSKPIYLAFSYDEEVGCLGVPFLLDYMDRHVPKPALAIIGEPTLMKVVTAHKGVLSFETTVHGLEWHSSQPHYGVNAVQAACELVHFLTGLARELTTGGKRDERFDPPYSTVHTGIIEGGTARNIIPKECRINWEIRPLPGENAEILIKRFHDYAATLLKEMRKTYDKADIVTVPKSRMAAVTLPAHGTSQAQLVKLCAQANQEFAVSFGTEAGVFNDHGIPAIVCGPGNIEQAHKPNEFIDAQQIAKCVEFMLRLCQEVSEKSLSVA